jgi:subtilase family serine protease
MHITDPVRLAHRRQAHLLAVALLLSVVLVAGCTGGSGGPAATVPARPASAAVFGCLRPPASCYAPHMLRVAYGIRPLLDRGIDGRGETVTVLATPLAPASSPPQCTGSVSTACPSPPSTATPAATDIRQDLRAFDRVFGLPAARIQVVNSLAGAASPWQVAGNEAGSLEMVHAVAPAATLRVVPLPADVLDSAATATADMIAGLRLAVSHTDVASIGWSLGEHFFTAAQVSQMHSILRRTAARHVTVVASSGDNGAISNQNGGTPVKEVSLPASDPLALAVGGTTLTANPSTGIYISETTWNGGAGSFSVTPGASGGGFSHLYARPAYQHGVPGISTKRGVPDVAGEASEQGGIPIVMAAGGQSSINQAPGTSASAALWAGLLALADQEAHHSLGLVNPAIYRIARGPSYHKAFHDITTGNNITLGPINYQYHAGPGWDPVTGWGSPNAQVLIPRLARS